MRDIDLVLVLDPSVVDDVLALLDRDDVYVPIEDAREALAYGGSFNVLHTTSGGKIDLFVVAPEGEFERSRVDRCVRADVLGRASWVATAEDVVLAKLKWRLDSRSDVQWRGSVEIVAVQELDRAYLWSLGLCSASSTIWPTFSARAR